MRVICVLFAKPPRPGRVKTRLAQDVGSDTAARVAQAMLRDTWRILVSNPRLEPVLATSDPTEDHGLLGPVEAWNQGQGDLGARVERMLRRALQQADVALAVGADSPGLSPGSYDRALQHLVVGEAALGPAQDGGFYLLGLRRCPLGVLRDLPWSQVQTFGATRIRLVTYGLAPRVLPPGWDVDELADLRELRRTVDRSRAPCTHEVLDALGWP